MDATRSTAQVQVQVSFVTVQEQHRVPDAPITVPTNLRRYGLSEIVNHLLGRDKPTPFDFIVGGQLLRTTLGKCLQLREISTEGVVTIEYIEYVPPPQPQDKGFPHDDWVSAVDGGGQRFHDTHGLLVTGSYDHMVRLWDHSFRCRAVLQGHTKPVRAVQFVGRPGSRPEHVLSASDDESSKLWKISPEHDNATLVCNYLGQLAPVHSLAASPDVQRLVTGAVDGAVRMFPTFPAADSVPVAEPPQKRTKRNSATAVSTPAPAAIQTPVALFEGHTAEVSGLAWPSASQIISGSWDHSIRVWDVSTALAATTMSSDKVVLGLSVSLRNHMIASAHDDRVVRLWDPRMTDGVVVKLRLASHVGLVSAVSWSPTSDFLLASASYDHTIKIWDTRSTSPLHTISAHSDKALCLDWNQTALLSGGADNQLRIMQQPSTTAAMEE